MDCVEEGNSSRKKSRQAIETASAIAQSRREIQKLKRENDSLRCEEHGESMKKMMENGSKSKPASGSDIIRTVKLRQNESNSKLGFSLRGGKEATGSSVGVFVSHVESCSEAQKKGLKIGDQVIQVNGLCVNQATYEDVIGLIKRTQRACDIILRVQYQARIPFQERAGDPISWLPIQQQQQQQVADCKHQAGNEDDDEEPLEVSYEDEGIASYESCGKRLSEEENSLLTSRRSSGGSSSASASSSSGGTCERLQAPQQSSTTQAAQRDKYRAGLRRQEVGGAQHGKSSGDSALSSALASCSSVDSHSTRSLGSLNSLSLGSSSLASVGGNLAREGGAYEPELSEQDDEALTLIRVAGGRSGADESFGCGVVKGPDEWPGIYVQTVRAKSLADRAGLEPGDQLIQAAEQPLAGLPFDEAIRLIKRLQAERAELQLRVRKGAALRYLAADRLATGCLGHHHPQVTQIAQVAALNSNAVDSAVGSAGSSSSSIDGCCDTQRQPGGETRKQSNKQQPLGASRAPKGKRQAAQCTKAAPRTELRQVNACNKWLPEEQPETKVSVDQVERSLASSSRHSYDDDDDDDDDDAAAAAAADGAAEATYGAHGDESQCNANEQQKSNSPPQQNNKALSSKNRLLEEVKSDEAVLSRSVKHLEEASHSSREASRASRPEMPDCFAQNRPTKEQPTSKQTSALKAVRAKQSVKKMEEKCAQFHRLQAPEDGEDKGGELETDEKQGEEIRIVRQNCKIHHHQYQSSQFKSSMLLAEKFRDHELHAQICKPREQQHVPLAARSQRSTCSLRSDAPASPHPSLTFGSASGPHSSASRNICIRSKQPKESLHLSRYLSMENVSLGSCELRPHHHHHLHQLQSNQTRGSGPSAACRLPTPSSQHYAQQQHHHHQQQQQQQHQVMLARQHIKNQHLMQATCCYEATTSSQHKQLYRRSSSVLGQAPATCCPLSEPSATCCRAVPSPGLQRALIRPIHSRVPSSCARLTKARSMDKLNMSINLSYLKIGLSSSTASQQQQQQHKQYVTKSALNNRLQRRQQQQQLQSLSCCSQPIYPKSHPLSPAPSCPECPPNELRHSNLMDSYHPPSSSSLIQQLAMGTAITCRDGELLSAAHRMSTATSSGNCSCSAFLGTRKPVRDPREFLSRGTNRSQAVTTGSTSECCPLCCGSSRQQASLSGLSGKTSTGKVSYQQQVAGYCNDMQVAHSCRQVESVYSMGTCEHDRRSSATSSSSSSSSLSQCLSSGSSHRHRELQQQGAFVAAGAPASHSHQQQCSRITHLQTKTCPPPPPPPPMSAVTEPTLQRENLSRPARQLTSFLAASSHSAPSARTQHAGHAGGSTGTTPPSPLSTASVSSSCSALSPSSTSSCSRLSSSVSPPKPPERSVSTRVAASSAAVASGIKLTAAPPPCPPPPPVADADFERNITADLWALKKKQQQAGEDSLASKLSAGIASERLCFVDELKMLASKQGASTTITESSTLIKIINASKQAAARGPTRGAPTCGCQQQQQQHHHQHQSKDLRCTKPGGLQLNPGVTSNRSKHEEQDNKRRQHEMLMKEFKSAHSRMFKRRLHAGTGSSSDRQQLKDEEESSGNANLIEDSNQQEQDVTTCAAAQQQQAKKKDPPPVPPVQKLRDSVIATQDREKVAETGIKINRHTTIKTIQTKKAPINLLLSKTAQHAPALHLAAAN